MWMLVFLLIHSPGVEGVQLCPEPDPVINAYRYSDDNFLEVGSWLNYTCYMNFIPLNGSLTRQCQLNGTFSNSPPMCIYTCGPPPNITDMVIEVPDPSLDGSVARYNCSHEPSITMLAVCSRELNAWNYTYTVCPPPENLYSVDRADKFNESYFSSMTDGNFSTCESKQGINKFWFTETMDFVSFIVNFGTMPADLKEIIIDVTKNNDELKPGKKSNDSCINYDAGDTRYIECSQGADGSFGKIINVEAVLNSSAEADLSICEIYVRGNYRNERCNGPPEFEYGAEAFYVESELHTKCLPGFYHHKGIDTVNCDDDTLNWLPTFITCWPEKKLIHIEAVNTDQRVLFDLQDDTCYNFQGGTDRILGTSPSPGNNMIITAISFKFNMKEDRQAFTETVFQVDGVLVHPSCYTQGSTKTKRNTLVCNFDPPAKGEQIEIVQNVSSTISLCELHVLGHINQQQAYECYPKQSHLYQGKMNHTIFGHACERWDGIPSSHPMVFDFLPDPSRTRAENYCRDPNRNHIRPWCFIKNYTEEQPCPILKCEDNCSKLKYGKDYEGKLNVTYMGTDCLDWNSININSSVQDSQKFKSYCRNPGHGYSSPWCFTDVDGTFERCDSVHCPKELQYVHYNKPSEFIGQLWFPECYWFNGTDSLRRYRVNMTDDWLTDWNSQNNSRLYCFGSDDLILTEFHIESYDLPTTTVTTEPTTTFTTLATTTTPTTTTADAETSSSVPATTTTASISTEPTTASTNAHTTTITTSTAKDTKTSSFVPATTTTSAGIINGSTSFRPIDPETHCYCRCNIEPSLLTHEVAEERIAQINKELYIEKEQLTSTIRKLTSAYDERPSATYLGSSALAIFSCVVLLIVLPDLFKVFYHLYIVFKNRLKGTSDNLI